MIQINRQREAILRFYAAINRLDYNDVVDEYLGKTDEMNWTNRLYQATEMAVHYMNEEL